MMRIMLSLLILTFALASGVYATERHLARFIFQEAEEAMARQAFELALAKLEETERALGRTNYKIVYLRVQARHSLLKKKPKDHALAIQLKEDADFFLKEYAGDAELRDVANEVYQVRQEVGRRLEAERAALASVQKAAEAGEISSMKRLIERYQKGLGVPKNAGKAKAWQKRLVAAEGQDALERAKSGDMSAMENVITRYENGEGLPKDLAQANAWREKLAVKQAKAQLRQAEAGDMLAMDAVIARYEKGEGLPKDLAQANAWREKYERARKAVEDEQTRRKLANDKAAREREIQAKVNEIDFYFFTQKSMELAIPKLDKPAEAGDIFSMITTVGPFSTIGAALDLVASPTKLTQVQLIKHDAAMRAASWGNSKSMIAKAFVADRTVFNARGIGSEAVPSGASW